MYDMYAFICTTHDHVMVKVEINLLTTYIKFGLTYFKLNYRFLFMSVSKSCFYNDCVSHPKTDKPLTDGRFKQLSHQIVRFKNRPLYDDV